MKVRGPITTSHNPIKKSRPRTIIHLHIYSFKFIYVCILYIEAYTTKHVHIGFDKISRGVRAQYLIFYEYMRLQGGPRAQYLIFYEYMYGNINNF